jgi:hypothetical protein
MTEKITPHDPDCATCTGKVKERSGGDRSSEAPTGHRIFVFGSNLAGRHGKGAALTARHQFGAEYGVGEGRTGRAYAIPTKDETLRPRSLDRIHASVRKFLDYARSEPSLYFKVTAIGCGLAGYKPEQIAPMFKGAPDNCELPPEFIPFLVTSDATEVFVCSACQDGQHAHCDSHICGCPCSDWDTPKGVSETATPRDFRDICADVYAAWLSDDDMPLALMQEMNAALVGAPRRPTATVDDSVAAERERCARIVEVLAHFMETGAGPLASPGARLRQASQSIREGDPSTLWTPDMQEDKDVWLPLPNCGHGAQSHAFACRECGAFPKEEPRRESAQAKPDDTGIRIDAAGAAQAEEEREEIKALRIKLAYQREREEDVRKQYLAITEGKNKGMLTLGKKLHQAREELKVVSAKNKAMVEHLGQDKDLRFIASAARDLVEYIGPEESVLSPTHARLVATLRGALGRLPADSSSNGDE